MPQTVTSCAVRSYRTLSPLPAPKRLGGILSAALVVGSRRPDVIWHPALWSPDFPPLSQAKAAITWPSPARMIPRLLNNTNRLIRRTPFS